MHRRAFLSASFLTLAFQCGPARPVRAERHFDHREAFRQQIIAKAQALGSDSFKKYVDHSAGALDGLGYDAYRGITNRHERAIWRGNSRVEVEPLLRGFIYPDSVALNLIDGDEVERVRWNPDFFEFGDVPAPKFAPDEGYSGLRLLTDLGQPGVAQEFVVFQGASYFRALAEGLRYGLSARGLALGSGEPEEEFPVFREFWVERPEPGAAEIVVHALMDSPSVAGAFMFTIFPGRGSGTGTRIGTNVSLFPRKDLPKIGLAPLTSMYWFGPLERGDVDDYRPRVHDSDGMFASKDTGEWLWHPLANPKTVKISEFEIGGASNRFGLAQRERDWNAYQDIEANYELRPSAWIEPHADWPDGRLVLVELPTATEFADNVVLFWRPDSAPAAGGRFDYGYDIVFAADPPAGIGLLRAVRASSGDYAGTQRLFVIDFDGPRPIDLGRLRADVAVEGGKAEGVTLSPMEETGGLRLTFLLVPEESSPDIEVRLLQGERPVSETWRYTWEG